MAQLEPMDVDDMNENKENAYKPNNVKLGPDIKEELDTSEMNLKLRYSTSPMSKSYSTMTLTDKEEDAKTNMTQSLNCSSYLPDTTLTGPRSLPLQSLTSEDTCDKTINVLRQLDSLISDDTNVTITVTKTDDNDDNISLPSSSSVTPEAVTPTKEISKPTSPIMRGLQSVFSMFRTSTSPIPPNEKDVISPNDNEIKVSEVLNPEVEIGEEENNSLTASTPLNTQKKGDSESRESIQDETVFQENFEKELEWNETTIIFSKEKFPIHKLLFNQSKYCPSPDSSTVCDVSMTEAIVENQSCEAMDVSYNDSGINKTLQGNNVTTSIATSNAQASDVTGSENNESLFLDCETTLNESQAQHMDKSLDVNRTVDRTLNDTSFISMQSAETVACTSDLTENLVTSEIFTKEAENGTDNILAESDVDKVLRAADSSSAKINTEYVSNTLHGDFKEELDDGVNLEHVETIVNPESVIKCQANILTEEQVHFVSELTENAIYQEQDQSEEVSNDEPKQVNLEDNTVCNMDIAAGFPISETGLEIQENSNIESEVILTQHKAEMKHDTTVEMLKLSAHVEITPDGSLVITTEDKEALEIATDSEDLSLVKADMLLVDDDQDQALSSDDEEPVQVNSINNRSDEIDKPKSEFSIQLLNEIETEESNDSKFHQISESEPVKEEVIILSESSSPYVSLGPATETSDETIGEIVTEPQIAKSPPITPKVGYNFNFEDIDNPFATRTRLSMSPTRQIATNKKKSPVADQIVESLPYVSEEVINSSANESYQNKNSPGILNEVHKDNSDPLTDIPNETAISPITNSIVNAEKETTESVVLNNEKISITEDKSEMVPEISSEISYVATETNPPNDDSFCEKSKKTLNATEIKSIETSETKCPHEQILPLTVDNTNKKQNEGVKNNIANSPETQSFAPLKEMAIVIEETKVNVAENLCNKVKYEEKCEVTATLEDAKILSKETEIVSSTSDHSEFHSMSSSPQDIVEANNVQRVSQSEPLKDSSCRFACLSQNPISNDVARSSNSLFKTNNEMNSQEPLTIPPIDSLIHEENRADNASDISATCSEDRDITIREIHTEDEDTAEASFIEAQSNENEERFSGFESAKSDCGIFDNLPQQANEEHFVPIESDEMFIDAEAFDFLMSQNRSNEVLSSGKESLFLKFDPLFAKRVNSDGILDVLAKVQKRQSTPKKFKHQSIMDMSNEEKSGSSNNQTFEVQAHETFNLNKIPMQNEFDETLNVGPKPTMIVTPVAPRTNMTTPLRSNRRSTGFSSPAIAVIDRLLSISANNSMGFDDTTVLHYNAEQEEADRALIELRELVAVKELEVSNLKTESKELKERLFTLESQMENLEREGTKRLQSINDLNEQLNDKDKINKSMKNVVEEYEKTIAGLIAEIESDKKRNAEEKMQLIRERDEQTAHLANMEGAFSDLHSKYEKSKQIIFSYKANEDGYKKSVEEFEASLVKMEKNYEALKQHATAQLDHANQELEKINKSHESEVIKLKAMLKRKDMHITSLEENIAQKIKANEELTSICDELISKVG